MNRRQFLRTMGAAFLTLLPAPLRSSTPDFPTPKELEPMVEFWMQVFTKYDSTTVIAHDMRDLSIIYEVVQYPVMARLTPEQRNRFLYENSGQSYTLDDSDSLNSLLKLSLQERLGHLAEMANSSYRPLPSTREGKEEEQNTLELQEHLGSKTAGMPAHEQQTYYRTLASQVRIQWCIRDRMLASFERERIYAKMIRDTFQQYGIPQDIVLLPHQESGFNTSAGSSRGALGIWQITSPAQRISFQGKRYYLQDRKDPAAATTHAAKLLLTEYEALDSWPLAIMAYHHGRSVVKAAQRQYGNDIAAIISGFRHPQFGFASRNYYPEFLAVRRIAENPEQYFGPLPMPQETPPPIAAAEAGASAITYTVQPHDNLTAIARRFSTTPREIAKNNSLRNMHRIRPGMQLIIYQRQ
ncbi:transglycosylase SLT domain-containing protein [Candidatus Woesearchaeota archaeon]|nr:transglycosylase SLT domain-containing protein [Candidatus Woesearchaeota archaeon]